MDHSTALVDLASTVPDALDSVPAEFREPGREMAPAGPLDADLLFVGEAPGANEAETGRPFVGRSGAVLNETLSAAGMDREEIYITAVAKIRPPDNRDPTRAEIDAWRSVLQAELDRVRPTGIVALGRIATYELLDERRPLRDLRGRVIEREPWWILPTYHPAAILYDPNKRADSVADLRRARELVGRHNPS